MSDGKPKLDLIYVIQSQHRFSRATGAQNETFPTKGGNLHQNTKRICLLSLMSCTGTLYPAYLIKKM